MKGYHPELIVLESSSLDVLLESLPVLLKPLHSRGENMIRIRSPHHGMSRGQTCLVIGAPEAGSCS